jgi:ABC-type phosphate/phosphonate transport system substrate-binding protein
MKKIIFMVALLIASVSTAGYVSAAEVKFGVMASRGNIKAMKKWGDMGKYLSVEIGSPVKIVPLHPKDAIKAVSSGKVDYALTNPVLTVIMVEKLGATPVVTMNKKTGSQFAGVIISKKGSGITKAADLKGKKVMGFKFKKSAAAYVFQVKHMVDNGIDPHKDFAVFKEAKKQDDIVLAVKAGAFDAGFVKSGLLEAMVKEGKISLSDFDIVDQKSDSLKAVHTTTLYPSWYVSAPSNADAVTSGKIKSALLKLDANNDASKKAKIVGFVEPLDLSGLKDTLKSLKLPPYN